MSLVVVHLVRLIRGLGLQLRVNITILVVMFLENLFLSFKDRVRPFPPNDWGPKYVYTTSNNSDLIASILIHVRKSKTDQTSKGIDKAIVSRNDIYCPVKHLLAWKKRLEGQGSVWRTINGKDKVTEKPLTMDAFYHRMKKYAKLVEGLDPERCSPHSLRSGFITQCGQNNVPFMLIQQQSGHTNPSSVSVYLRNEDKFKNNAGYYLRQT